MILRYIQVYLYIQIQTRERFGKDKDAWAKLMECDEESEALRNSEIQWEISFEEGEWVWA